MWLYGDKKKMKDQTGMLSDQELELATRLLRINDQNTELLYRERDAKRLLTEVLSIVKALKTPTFEPLIVRIEKFLAKEEV
jgi:hypothetical protein